ncbi:MAG: alpha-amylase/4-alpha-glucanotransferase domain-containing protein [Pseudomonadota bacterium]
MTKTVSLLFGVHAHQPVGNFPEVLDDAHRRCYRPFLQVLHRFPEFRFAVHFSGWLLDYLNEKYPQDMALLKDMVARGQVELFGAGDTEPVLAVIPNRDRVGQLRRLSDKLARKYGERPQGAWLTERVWEATVVPALADTGIRYVTVDDYHFLCTGKHADELRGYYTTEEDGRQLDLFPISEALRYRIPFAPAQEVVAYLEGMADDNAAAAVYFDDIEKFGIWPETYQWVYERGWLEQFIQGVLASKIIRAETYRDYYARVGTRGIIYLPTTSYIEMNEWTLPAEAANAYAGLVQAEKAHGSYEAHKAFLRGGIWKNFFCRYPESNWMHKRMLALSERVAALPDDRRSGEMLDLLYTAQANDAYWHGLFGGLYLPHLRRAVYGAMVRLENRLDRVAPRQTMQGIDLDRDGVDEIFLHNDDLQAVVKLDGSASLCEFDAYRLAHNFGDTLRRQTEHYFCKIQSQPDQLSQHSGEGIASAHDRVAFKHEIALSDLEPDRRAVALFADQWQHDGAAQDVAYRLAEASAAGLEFVAALDGGELRKCIVLEGNRLRVSYHAHGNVVGRLLTTIALAMPSCDGFAGRYIHNGGVPGGFGMALELEAVREIALDDDVLGGHVALRASHPVQLRGAPYFTVSQSEAGFEKIMQAVELGLQWRLAGAEMVITLEVNQGKKHV